MLNLFFAMGYRFKNPLIFLLHKQAILKDSGSLLAARQAGDDTPCFRSTICNYLFVIYINKVIKIRMANIVKIFDTFFDKNDFLPVTKKYI